MFNVNTHFNNSTAILNKIFCSTISLQCYTTMPTFPIILILLKYYYEMLIAEPIYDENICFAGPINWLWKGITGPTIRML